MQLGVLEALNFCKVLILSSSSRLPCIPLRTVSVCVAVPRWKQLLQKQCSDVVSGEVGKEENYTAS
jgi:hypothetical protein